MKRFCFLLLTVVFIASFLACDKPNDASPEVNSGMDMKGSEDDNNNTVNAEQAPDFSLSDLNGNVVSLSDYTEKVIAIFFFGNACPPCKAVAPSVQTQLSDKYASRDDFILLGIDQWDGNNSAVKAFKSSTGVTFPLLLNGSSVAASFGTTYDRIVVIDKEGLIRFKGNRNVSSDLSTAVDVVAQYLNK
ncbi:TlpA family protein disulfide reductase [Labilibacter sediminis]|nr:TlpA family protein disulfide reductase [Labilibacter sediminis]